VSYCSTLWLRTDRIVSASYLWHHVSPAIPIIFAYLFFICLSSFIHASVVDPGVRHLIYGDI
jgi:hypothetical protein